MNISLVVATRNRSGVLRRLLTSLTAQQFTAFETILVDQSSPEEHARNGTLVTAFADRLRIRHIHTPVPGLSRARNMGMRAATGEIVGFPDDDCWYPPELLASLVQIFTTETGTSFLVGRYTEPGVSNPAFPATGYPIVGVSQVDVTNSVSLFVRSQSLRAAALSFDENLGAGTPIPAGEEVDFALRAVAAGLRGAYDPQITVYHAIGRDMSDSEFLMGRELARGYLLGKSIRHWRVAAKAAGGVGRLALNGVLHPSELFRLAPRLRGLMLGMRTAISAHASTSSGGRTR